MITSSLSLDYKNCNYGAFPIREKIQTINASGYEFDLRLQITPIDGASFREEIEVSLDLMKKSIIDHYDLYFKNH